MAYTREAVFGACPNKVGSIRVAMKKAGVPATYRASYYTSSYAAIRMDFISEGYQGSE